MRSVFRPSLVAIGVLSLGGHVAAQLNPIGLTFNNDTGATSRGSLGDNPGELLTRVDARDYRGWATDLLQPLKHVVHGLTVGVQDQDLATQEAFDIVGYNGVDDDNPDLTAAMASVTGLMLPTGTGPGAATVNVTFATPVVADATKSTFWGVKVPAVGAAGWPNDGVSSHIYLGYQPNATFSVFDIPGPRPVDNGSYGLQVDAMGAVTYLPARQLVLDLLAPTAGGTATALTNQTSLPSSNAAPGTTSLFSGLHPDLLATPLNPGRADDPGYVAIDHRLAGDNVIIALGIAFNPVVLPLAGIGAGSDGTLCIHPILVIPVQAVVADANGVASYTIALTATQRATLVTSDIFWTAVGLDGGTMARGCPCARQQL